MPARKASSLAPPRSAVAALAEVSEGIRAEAERDLKWCTDGSSLPKPLYNARLFLPDGTLLPMPDAWWPEAGAAGWKAGWPARFQNLKAAIEKGPEQPARRGLHLG